MNEQLLPTTAVIGHVGCLIGKLKHSNLGIPNVFGHFYLSTQKVLCVIQPDANEPGILQAEFQKGKRRGIILQRVVWLLSNTAPGDRGMGLET